MIEFLRAVRAEAIWDEFVHHCLARQHLPAWWIIDNAVELRRNLAEELWKSDGALTIH